MDLQFEHVRTSLLRNCVAKGDLSEVEFAMLKKYAEKLRWGLDEKSLLMDLATDTYAAKNPVMQLEVVIRSLCHSRSVTADYVSLADRFNLKPVVLILGHLGEMASAWSEHVQTALHLYASDFNILWVEIPAFATNSAKWMRYGPAILIAALKELKIDTVKVLASGVGGSVFLETLRKNPKYFGKTHMVYNFDLPRGSRGLPFSISELEELLRERELQLWFAYQDEDGVFDRTDWGTPMKAFEAVVKLQARLEGERRRGFRQLDYDEVILTEALNTERGGKILVQTVRRISVGLNAILSWSQAFLQSLALYYEMPPQTYQEDLEGGLPPQSTVKKKFRPPLPFPKGPDGELPELPALRRIRLGPEPNERPAIADKNRGRMDRVAAATLYLMPASKRPALPPPLAGSGGGSRRPSGESALKSVASAPALGHGSQDMPIRASRSLASGDMPIRASRNLASGDMLALPAPAHLDDDEESLFDSEHHFKDLSNSRGESPSALYNHMWQSLRTQYA